MYHHPNIKRINISEGEAATAPSPNPPDNNPIPTPWFSEDDDSDTDAISNSNSNSNSTPASSPPFFPTSHGKANPPTVFPPKPPFSPSPSPTPAPRPARTSDLQSSRIASYEARNTGTNTRPRFPSPDKATTPSSASSPLANFYNAATQVFPVPYPSPKPEYSLEVRGSPGCTAVSESLSGEETRTSSSVSSQLSPFADFYVAATDDFPAFPEDGGLDREDSEQFFGSRGTSRGRRVVVVREVDGGVAGDAEDECAVEEEEEEGSDEEEQEEEEEEEEVSATHLPPLSRFQNGGDDDVMAFTVGTSGSGQGRSRLLSWERDGTVDSRVSRISFAPSCLDLPDAPGEKEARLYWDDVMAEIDEVADGVVRDDSTDPSYPRVNSEFSRSNIPPRHEHSEPPELSERKPDGEEILQVYLSGFPKYEVSGVFFDRTERLNNEAERRAICIDDPDADPTPLPNCVECKNPKLPLHERLSNKLPSPSIFTPETYRYRSWEHDLEDIEVASTALGLQLKSNSLKARAVQYSENRKIIERALKKDRILREAPSVGETLKCQYGHSVRAPGSMSCGPQDPGTIPDADTLQSLLLGRQELRRDIERLEGLQRGIRACISTLDILPIRYRGKVLQRRTLAYEVDKLRQKRLATNEDLSDVPVDEPCPLDHDVYRALVALDPNAPSMSSATATLATGKSFPSVHQARPRRPATRRSSSVYSDRPVRLRSGATTPHAVFEEPGHTDRGDVPDLSQPGSHYRAAAYRIMQSVQTYHNSGNSN